MTILDTQFCRLHTSSGMHYSYVQDTYCPPELSTFRVVPHFLISNFVGSFATQLCLTAVQNWTTNICTEKYLVAILCSAYAGLKKVPIFLRWKRYSKIVGISRVKIYVFIALFYVRYQQKSRFINRKIFRGNKWNFCFFAALQKVVLKTGMQSMYLKISMYSQYRVPHTHSDHLIYRRMLGSDKKWPFLLVI